MYPSSPLPVMPNAPRARPAMVPRARGFSLIELMVAVAILAILLALAVPSFQDMIQRNRVRTAAADLTDALNLTRSEAIKRGSSTRLCIDGDNAWEVELISAAETLREGRLSEDLTITPAPEPADGGPYSVGSSNCVRFRPDGLAYGNASPMTAGTLTLEAGSHQRVINITAGSIHVTED